MSQPSAPLPSHAPAGHSVDFKLAAHDISLQAGRIARQASGAVVARCGDLVILATVVLGESAKDVDFLPLTVEYREKLAAAGQIPGTYNRREGRISDHEVLMSRLIDRTVRSLFPAGFHHEVQIQVTVLSADGRTDLTTMALVAACAALHLSPAPALGPAAGVRVTGDPDRFECMATEDRRKTAALDLVVGAGPKGLVMVEGSAREVGESACADALRAAQAWLDRLQAQIERLRTMAGKAKWPEPEPERLAEPDAELVVRLRQALDQQKGKDERRSAIRAVRDQALADWQNGGLDESECGRRLRAFDEAHHRLVRAAILAGQRPDGRDHSTIRPIWGEVGLLPRAHGSALFTRGETQAIATCTLGTADDAVRQQTLGGTSQEHFLLHYNFPPYSVNEARPLRGVGRREIGHGHLAQRGLAAILPDPDSFPYVLRIESEVTESNGSSSMATVCAGCLAMLHAGVPLVRPVAGIAMGLVSDGERVAILSDIVGEEDHLGDMDCKVVGSSIGITALQLDNKLGGLSIDLLLQALEQARVGREHILACMAQIQASPSAEMAAHAPRVLQTAIVPAHIGILVGPRGANIREIQASTKTRISVDDHGIVRIYAADGEAASKARLRIEQQVGVVSAGLVYHGVVTSVRDFGFFVKINEVNEGLVPRGEAAGDVQSGDTVVVKVTGTDERGRLSLSHRAAINVDPARITF